MRNATPVTYIRRRPKPLLDTFNTPFPTLPRDLIELLLDLLNTRSVFNLMLVSHNTKIIAYSDDHLKKRLHLLFDSKRISSHLITMTSLYTTTVPKGMHRLITVQMINKQRNKKDLLKILGEDSYGILIHDSGIAALNETTE